MRRSPPATTTAASQFETWSPPTWSAESASPRAGSVGRWNGEVGEAEDGEENDDGVGDVAGGDLSLAQIGGDVPAPLVGELDEVLELETSVEGSDEVRDVNLQAILLEGAEDVVTLLVEEAEAGEFGDEATIVLGDNGDAVLGEVADKKAVEDGPSGAEVVGDEGEVGDDEDHLRGDAAEGVVGGVDKGARRRDRWTRGWGRTEGWIGG